MLSGTDTVAQRVAHQLPRCLRAGWWGFLLAPVSVESIKFWIFKPDLDSGYAGHSGISMLLSCNSWRNDN
jgi:hypothetical protein